MKNLVDLTELPATRLANDIRKLFCQIYWRAFVIQKVFKCNRNKSLRSINFNHTWKIKLFSK